MWKVLRTVFEEVAITFRGFVLFYLDFFALIRPDASPRRTPWRMLVNLFLALLAVGAIIFYVYVFPSWGVTGTGMLVDNRVEVTWYDTSADWDPGVPHEMVLGMSEVYTATSETDLLLGEIRLARTVGTSEPREVAWRLVTLEEGERRATAMIAGVIVAVVLLLLAGWMIASIRPHMYAVKEIGKSLLVMVTLLIVLGHPTFSGPMKLAAAALLVVGVVAVAKMYLQQSAAAKVGDRPLVRGRILALLPFYLTAATCIFWGVNQTVGGGVHYLMTQRGNYYTFNQPDVVEARWDEGIRQAGRIEMELRALRERHGGVIPAAVYSYDATEKDVDWPALGLDTAKKRLEGDELQRAATGTDEEKAALAQRFTYENFKEKDYKVELKEPVTDPDGTVTGWKAYEVFVKTSVLGGPKGTYRIDHRGQVVGDNPREAPKDDPRFTNEIDGWTFWGYTLQKATGLAMAPMFEKVYWMLVHPVADGLGAEWGEAADFRVGRIQSYSLITEILENLMVILTTAFFLGVFADIAVTVQRRIQTGQADLDLSKDHGVALLTAVHGLQSRSEAKMVRGSWRMMQQINDRAVDGLIEHLRHKDPAVRASAAWALGELGARRAVPELAYCYAERETRLRVRAAELDTLSRLAPVLAQPHLKAAVRGEDPVLANTALAVLTDIVNGKITAAAAAPDELAAKATNGNGNGKTGEAGENAAGDGDENAKPAITEAGIARQKLAELDAALKTGVRDTLIACLDAPHDDIRRRIVQLMAMLDPATTGARLLEELDAKHEDRWVEGALEALGELDWAAGEETLIEYATENKTPSIRRAALAGLGYHSGEAGLPVLRKAVDESDAETRAAVFAALGHRGSADDLPLLITGLHDDGDDARLAAAIALRQVCARQRAAGTPIEVDVITPLKDIASNREDSLLRDQACFALAELRADEAVDILINLLPDPEAAEALGMLADPALKPELDNASQVKVIKALYMAARATIGEPEMSKPRNAPILALGRYRHREAQNKLRDLYGERPYDRRVIADALADTVDAEDARDPVVHFLCAMFGPKDRTAAEYLAPALAQTGHPEAARKLREMLHTSIAPLAARALGEMRDADSIPELMGLTNSADSATRDAVFGALRRFSEDPEFNADVMDALQKQLRGMGAGAANLMRFMVRFAGSLLGGADEGDEPTRRPTSTGPRVPADDVLAEFG